MLSLEGIIEVPLGSDESSEVVVKDCVRPDGAAAQTRLRVSCRFTRAEGDFTWLPVEPMTGRKHQIRLQLSHQGHPILGDRKYGSKVSFPAGIALHAYSLSFQHPVQNECGNTWQGLRWSSPSHGTAYMRHHRKISLYRC